MTLETILIITGFLLLWHLFVIHYLAKWVYNFVQKYEDIHKMNIGVLSGSAYFSTFDNDPAIKKHAVLKTEQLLMMLKAGRIDALLGTETVTDYLIRTEGYKGLFEKSIYKYEKETPFYLAISKKSQFAQNILQFNQIMQFLIDDKKILSIIEKYKGSYK